MPSDDLLHIDSLADSVQFDPKTEKKYFALPMTAKMTIRELFEKLGTYFLTKHLDPNSHCFLL